MTICATALSDMWFRSGVEEIFDHVAAVSDLVVATDRGWVNELYPVVVIDL